MDDLKKYSSRAQYLRTIYNWINQLVDPFRMLRAPRNLIWYIKDWHRYTHLSGAESIRLVDSWPQLEDRVCKTPIDPHYFYANGWAMRRIMMQRPLQHVDIGSQAIFVNLLSAVLPVIFVDYRPLEAGIEGLINRRGDILNLPFADQSVESLSCLHVAEHIGLGRYGDSLNPTGTRQACYELQRVLKTGGNLYFSVPVGRPRVCFNAHRIHAPATIMEYFSGLELIEFSGVHDDGLYTERVKLDEFVGDRYACGMFWLKKAVGEIQNRMRLLFSNATSHCE